MSASDDPRGASGDDAAAHLEPKGPEREAAGLRPSDLLTLPEPSRQMLSWMIREGATGLTDLATGLRWDESATRSVLRGLLAQGFVLEIGTPEEARYRVRLARHRARGTGRDLWRGTGETSGE